MTEEPEATRIATLEARLKHLEEAVVALQIAMSRLGYAVFGPAIAFDLARLTDEEVDRMRSILDNFTAKAAAGQGPSVEEYVHRVNEAVPVPQMAPSDFPGFIAHFLRVGEYKALYESLRKAGLPALQDDRL